MSLSPSQPNARTFETVLWANTPDPEGLGREDYRIVHRSPGIADPIASAFHKQARRFEWSLATAEPHEPAWVIWNFPSDDGAESRLMVGRILDVGRDDQGRPHTLRIEAALVDPPELETAAALINDQAWPKAPWSPPEHDAPLTLTPQTAEPRLVRQLEAVLAHRSGRTAVLGIKRLSLDPDHRRTIDPISKGDDVEPASPTTSVATRPDPRSGMKGNSHLYVVFILIVCLVVLLIGFFLYSNTPRLFEIPESSNSIDADVAPSSPTRDDNGMREEFEGDSASTLRELDIPNLESTSDDIDLMGEQDRIGVPQQNPQSGESTVGVPKIPEDESPNLFRPIKRLLKMVEGEKNSEAFDEDESSADPD